MQQTLLALVAILIFSFFALSQHEVRADAEVTALSAEVEMAGARLARERLADVLSRRFDEQDESHTRARTTPLGLTAAADLGPDADETLEADFDDVDDFHGRPARVLETEWMGQRVTFTDSVTVRYIEYGASGAFEEVDARTLMKQVTVYVRAQPDGFVGTPPIAATLRQIATPTS